MRLGRYHCGGDLGETAALGGGGGLGESVMAGATLKSFASVNHGRSIAVTDVVDPPPLVLAIDEVTLRARAPAPDAEILEVSVADVVGRLAGLKCVDAAVIEAKHRIRWPRPNQEKTSNIISVS